MRSTFSILFYLKKNNVKKSGYAPLMVRITINGVSAPFSLKTEAKPGDWDTKAGRVRGRTKEANTLNSYLEDVSSKIRRNYRELCDKGGNVTAEMVRDAYQGLSTHRDTLLCSFDRHNTDYQTLVGKQTTNGTYKKYLAVRDELRQFLKQKKKLEDIALKDITPQFVNDFERFLFVDCEFHRNTAMKYMQKFKRIVVMAHNNGLLSTNPFVSYKLQFEPTDRGYLSEEELMTLMRHPVECSEMEIARDVFVFSCFTGLSFADLKGLQEENIKLSFDGQMWIMTKRQKTNVQSNIPLLPIPQQILEKYKGKCNGDMILPVQGNKDGNAELKKLGKECGISTKVTFHLARHTFATLMLSKGVPIETVSKMLGHKSVRTTQIYARIVNSKVSSDMEILSHKLGKLEQVYQLMKAS